LASELEGSNRNFEQPFWGSGPKLGASTLDGHHHHGIALSEEDLFAISGPYRLDAASRRDLPAV